MIESIPHADEADIAEQARPVGDGIEECDTLPDALGDNRDADVADLIDQKLSVSGQDDDHPPVASGAAAALASDGGFPAGPGNPIRSQHNGRSLTTWHR